MISSVCLPSISDCISFLRKNPKIAVIGAAIVVIGTWASRAAATDPKEPPPIRYSKHEEKE